MAIADHLSLSRIFIFLSDDFLKPFKNASQRKEDRILVCSLNDICLTAKINSHRQIEERKKQNNFPTQNKCGKWNTFSQSTITDIFPME